MLKQKVQEDLKEAIHKKEELRISVLRMFLASILNKEKEKRYKISKSEPNLKEEELVKKSELNDEEIIDVISSEIKKRKEAIAEFSAHGGSASGREKEKIDKIIAKEKSESEILQKYLPEQISEEDIKKLVQESIEKIGAKEIKDMGKVMQDLMPKIKGRADNSLVSKIVKESLSIK